MSDEGKSKSGEAAEGKRGVDRNPHRDAGQTDSDRLPGQNQGPGSPDDRGDNRARYPVRPEDAKKP